MEFTDTQLKQALAKMLPDIICNGSPQGDAGLFWRPVFKYSAGNYKEVLDTELLHLCWMVEESMNAELYINKYIETLYLECGNGRAAAHASWQQRTIALCKVKGIKL
jgi:hypothetical protein